MPWPWPRFPHSYHCTRQNFTLGRRLRAFSMHGSPEASRVTWNVRGTRDCQSCQKNSGASHVAASASAFILLTSSSACCMCSIALAFSNLLPLSWSSAPVHACVIHVVLARLVRWRVGRFSVQWQPVHMCSRLAARHQPTVVSYNSVMRSCADGDLPVSVASSGEWRGHVSMEEGLFMHYLARGAEGVCNFLCAYCSWLKM